MTFLSKAMQPWWCLRIAVLLFGGLTASCASQLRPPTAPLSVEVRSVDFTSGSAQQILFQAKGFVRNPNEHDISRLGFTYQTFIDNQLVDTGDVESPLRFSFKSRTPFTVPVIIPTNAVGGFVAASRYNGVRYRLVLRVSDGRFKNASLEHEGTLNLSPVVALPTISARAANNNAQLVVRAQVHNPNPFILVMDSCSMRLDDTNAEHTILENNALAPNNATNFDFILPQQVPTGTRLNASYVCSVNGEPITSNATLIVE